MRNIQKAVEDYKKINERRTGGTGGITAYDAVQILDAAAQKSGGGGYPGKDTSGTGSRLCNRIPGGPKGCQKETRVQRFIREYSGMNHAGFCYADVLDLFNTARRETGPYEQLYTAIMNALQFGYVAGVKDARNNQAEA